MSASFSYHLSVPIDDKRRMVQLEKLALQHNRKGMLAPMVRDFIYDLADGKFVRISPSTSALPASKRRIE
jgi:hypothetical protein